jgi:phenylalanyl-tRNA synthetase beta chain
MLETMCFNSRFSDQLVFYEIGKIYLSRSHEELPKEARRLGIILKGPADMTWWAGSVSVMAGFFHLKGILEALFERMGVGPCRYEPATYQPFHPGKCALVNINGSGLGFLGELHPEVQRNFELPDEPVIAAELDLDVLFKKRKEIRYRTISPFPTAKEDLAVVLDEAIPAEEVIKVAFEAGMPLVKEAIVFDVWSGQNIPSGKKSIAFSLTYQAEDRVLKADEMRETRERILIRLSDTLGARLRE